MLAEKLDSTTSLSMSIEEFSSTEKPQLQGTSQSCFPRTPKQYSEKFTKTVIKPLMFGTPCTKPIRTTTIVTSDSKWAFTSAYIGISSSMPSNPVPSFTEKTQSRSSFRRTYTSRLATFLPLRLSKRMVIRWVLPMQHITISFLSI